MGKTNLIFLSLVLIMTSNQSYLVYLCTDDVVVCLRHCLNVVTGYCISDSAQTISFSFLMRKPDRDIIGTGSKCFFADKSGKKSLV